jgi:hypothetical protein
VLIPILVAGSPLCANPNKFVHLALQKTLSFALEVFDDEKPLRDVLSDGLKITIVGDNDFYSQRRAVSVQSIVFFLSLALKYAFGHSLQRGAWNLRSNRYLSFPLSRRLAFQSHKCIKLD